MLCVQTELDTRGATLKPTISTWWPFCSYFKTSMASKLNGRRVVNTGNATDETFSYTKNVVARGRSIFFLLLLLVFARQANETERLKYVRAQLLHGSVRTRGL